MTKVLLAIVVAPLIFGVAALSAGGLIGARAAQTEIEVDNFYFCGEAFQGSVCEKTIAAGDTVVWSVEGGSHTVTQCDESFANCPPAGGFNSGTLSQGQTFSHTFDTPGTFFYHCNFHPTQMKGKLTVQAPATPTPTPTPATTTPPTASPTAPRPSATPASVPKTGGDPDGSAGTLPGIFILAGALAAIAGGILVLRPMRARSR